ncbi:MAG: hypothetical protein Fur0032_13650 [Terrimicrobiaceae bacterium]
MKIAIALAAVFLMAGCGTLEDMRAAGQRRAINKQKQAERELAASEHALYRSLANWRKNTYRNKALLAKATPDNTSIKISLPEQRGCLYVEGALAMDFPVATGKKSHPTPVGDFTILAKEKDYASNLYGKIYDATGTVIVSDADSRTDAEPEGGYFVGAQMPYWMRLTQDGVGLHVGYVPGRPASHGCIRLKNDVAREIFAITKVGTPVSIVNEPLVPTKSEG